MLARSARRSAFSSALISSQRRLTSSGERSSVSAEHMRMPADELSRDGLDHVAEREGALLLGHAGMEDDLEQQVAELVPQIREIAALDGVGDLVGFLDGVGRDRREILLQIPGAAGPGRAQGRHDLEEPCDVCGRLHGGFPESLHPSHSLRTKHWASWICAIRRR